MGTNTYSSTEGPTPVPPFADWTEVRPLVYTLATVTVILTVKVQESPAARIAPDKVTLALPEAAIAVPPQVLMSPFGEATNISGGKLPASERPVRGAPFAAGLVIV
jgi:hypothetical protein